MVVGDLNVNSSKVKLGLDLAKNEFKTKGIEMTENDKINFKQYEEEYYDMLKILSNFE